MTWRSNAKVSALPSEAARSEVRTLPSLKRRLLSGGTWALGGRMALAVIALTTNVLLARLLSPAELGAYFLAYSMVGICTGLGALGLTKAIVRFVAESVGLEQYGRARCAIKLSLSFGSLGALAVGLTYLLFGGRLAASLFDSPALAAVAGVTAGWIAVAVIQGILVEVFRGFHDIRMTITLGGVASGNGILSGGLLSLLLLLFWLFRCDTSLTTVMLLSAGSGAVSTLLAGWLLRHRLVSLPREDFDTQVRTGELMRVSWPLMITTLALFAVGQSSLWVAGAFLGQEDVALYGTAYRVVTYVAVPLQIANMVAPPLIAEMYAQGRKHKLEHMLRGIATTASIPAFLLLAAFVLFGGPMMGLLFGDYYREAGVLLAVLSLGQMVKVWTGSSEQVLTMSGHQTAIMTITAATVLLMSGGAAWAAQHYGMIGVAVATAIVMILQNIVMLLVVRKKTGVWTSARLSGLLFTVRPKR